MLKLDAFSENSTRRGSSVGGGDCSGFSGIDTEFGLGDVVNGDVGGTVVGMSDGSWQYCNTLPIYKHLVSSLRYSSTGSIDLDTSLRS